MRIVSPLSYISLAYSLSISDLILGHLVATAQSARAPGTKLRRNALTSPSPSPSPCLLDLKNQVALRARPEV